MTNIREEKRIERVKENTKNQLIKEVYENKGHKVVDTLERQLSDKLNKIMLDTPTDKKE